MKFCADDIRDKLAKVEGDARSIWQTVQKLLHSNPPVCQNDAKCASLSFAFSQFFVDKINRIRDSITTALQSFTGTGSHLFVTQTYVSNELSSFSPVTEGDVRHVLSKMPSKLSPLDAVPITLLKSCADVFVPIIVRLANLSFTEGHFPEIQEGTDDAAAEKVGFR